MATSPTRTCIRLAAPALSVLLLKQEQPAWLPRLSLLAALGFTSAMVSDYGADFAWCADSSGPATDAYVVSDAIRTKYGRYPPWCRLNVDQVPLPFVNDMEQTYEVRGAKRVIINQLGPALSKRQATGQVCFRPAVPPRSGCTNSEARRLYDKYLLEQPAPCIIFRGKGNISEVERAAYPQGLVVLWQDKAWVDRPLAVEWVEVVIKPFIEAERHAGVAMRWTRYLLFQDNLDSQKQPEYIDLLKEWCVDDHTSYLRMRLIRCSQLTVGSVDRSKYTSGSTWTNGWIMTTTWSGGRTIASLHLTGAFFWAPGITKHATKPFKVKPSANTLSMPEHC